MIFMECFGQLPYNVQRWANSVLRTEYKYEYYSSSKKWPNTNTNIIRFEKITRIRILFGLKKSPEYEYEYYSVWKYRPNTNTNILVFEYYSNNIRIPNYSLTSEAYPWRLERSHASAVESSCLWIQIKLSLPLYHCLSRRPFLVSFAPGVHL